MDAAGTAATHYLQYDITWASIALLYYDYSLTFTREVKYIWGKKISLRTLLLYVLCRYALLANVVYLLSISNVLQNCDVWYRFAAALGVLGRAAITVTLIARAHAVCARNRILLIFLGCLGLSCVVADVIHIPGEKCVNSTNAPISNLLRSLLPIIFESLVAFMTTVRTFQALRVGGPWRSQKRRLFYLIFEEGILYFCLISVLAIASVILDLRAPAGFLQRLLSGLTLPLSGFLTARFLLHLQAWKANHSGVFIVSSTGGIAALSDYSTETDPGIRRHPAWSLEDSRHTAPTPGHSTQVLDYNTTEVASLISTHEFGEDPVYLARRLSDPAVLEIRKERRVQEDPDSDTLSPSLINLILSHNEEQELASTGVIPVEPSERPVGDAKDMV